MPTDNRYINLLSRITTGRGKPVDKWEIAALIESNGIRDIDAKEEWEAENVFALAEKLYEYVDLITYEEKKIEIEEEKLVRRVFLNYLKGMLFAIPMVLQIVTMVILGIGIWSYVHFSLREATAIAFGTLLALASTGGVAQVIGRKGLFYLKFGEYLLASKVTKRFYIVGLILVIVLAIFLAFLNYFMNLFPGYMMKIAIYYYVLLSIIFLVFSIFYMLNDYFSIASIIASGIILVSIFFYKLEFGIYTSQIITMVIVIIISNIVALKKLRKLELINYAEGVVLPKAGTLFYTLYPFFCMVSPIFCSW